MYIYRIINLINEKGYTGKREISNFDGDDEYLGSGTLLNRAIKKHGKENFRKELIEDNITNVELLNFKEKYYIEAFDTLVPNGYNISTGGDGGDNFTNNPRKEEIRQEISVINKGVIRSDSWKQKMSIANTGKKRTETQKDKMRGRIPWNKGLTKEIDSRIKEHKINEKQHQSIIKNNKKRKNKTFEQLYGIEKAQELRKKRSEESAKHKHTEETKQKISKKKTGVKFSEQHKENIGKVRRGRTYEEIYGYEKAQELRKKRSEEMKLRHLKIK